MWGWDKKQLEMMGMRQLIDGPASVEQLKDLVTDRWRTPRSPCDEVYPKIFIGSEVAAKDPALLKKLGVTHIVNLACTEVKTGEIFYIQQGHRFTLLTLEVGDTPTSSISPFFEEVNRFIEVALHAGGKVLLHSKEGVSRPAAFTIAYLMMRRRMCALEAVKTVRRKRHVRPNDGFLQELCKLDEKLRKIRDL